MNILRILGLLSMALSLVACAVTGEKDASTQGQERHYAIVEVLPQSIEGFHYGGSATYPDPWGYSLRYRSEERGNIHADIYLYAVPPESRAGGREAIIDATLDGALQEITYVMEQGEYSEVKVLGRDKITVGDHPVGRVALYLVRNNLAVFSLIYVTESEGRLLKVRMSMPDNKANRGSGKWDLFVREAFTVILANMDKV